MSVRGTETTQKGERKGECEEGGRRKRKEGRGGGVKGGLGSGTTTKERFRKETPK